MASRQRRRQPQYLADIDWGKSLAAGLVADFSCANTMDVVTRQPLSVVGNITASVGQAGRSFKGIKQASNHYIDLQRPQLPNNQITLEALITVKSYYTAAAPYLDGILSGYQSSAAGDVAYLGPVLRLNDNATLAQAGKPTFILLGGTTEYSVTSASVVPFGELVHILGTYDGVTQSLYINGNLVASAAPSITFAYHANTFFSGLSDYAATDAASNRCLDGEAFILRVYDKSKTAEQAEKLADNPWGIYKPIRQAFTFYSAETSVLRSIICNIEALSSLGALHVRNFESLLSVDDSTIANSEALASPAKSTTSNIEAIGTVSRVRVANYEALQPVSDTTGTNYESLLLVSDTTGSNYEALATPTKSVIINLEALGSATVAALALANIEALASPSKSMAGNIESVKSINAVSTLNIEALKLVSLGGAFNYEAIGIVKTLMQGQYEAARSVSTSVVLNNESLRALSKIFNVNIEALQGASINQIINYADGTVTFTLTLNKEVLFATTINKDLIF